MMAFHDFFKLDIATWEGGLSLDPVDAGNWYDPATGTCRRGVGELIGSNHGVTAAVLATWRHTLAIGKADMAALSFDEAATIAEALFYRRPGFDQLPWDPAIASAVDFGWGAGPVHGVLIVQQVAGCRQDGDVGRGTILAWQQFVGRAGIAAAARAIEKARIDYYEAVIARIPADAKYRHGWDNRTDYFAPGGAWWRRFTV